MPGALGPWAIRAIKERARLFFLADAASRARDRGYGISGSLTSFVPRKDTKQKRGGIAPAALPSFETRWSRAESAPMPS
jgi:hypothetical protein